MRWVRVWLACVALVYPLYWAFASFAGVAPALIRVALFGHRLQHMQVWFFGAAATSVLADFSGDVKPGVPQPDPLRLAATLLLVLAILAARRRGPLGGLAIAMLGYAGLQPLAFRMVSRGDIDVAAASESFFFFGILCLGSWRMAAGWIPKGYWARAGSLFAALVVPVAGMWGVLAIVVFRPMQRHWWAPAIPGALASLVVSWPRRGASSEPPRIGWTPVGIGVVATVLLSFGIPRANMAVTLAWKRAQLEASRAAMAAIPKIPPDLPYPKLSFQKGVNFTADYPESYTSERARQMLGILRKHGVNAVALVPYGRSSRIPAMVRVVAGIESLESDEGLEQLSRVAHQLGIAILLKPHLGGRTELDFSSPEARAKWFADYTLFVEHYARLARRIHADLFCVGAEFVKLARYEGEWRKVIARARELYPGPLVYAANQGPEFETVAFWDALDYIGLDNYYPLPDDLSADAIVRKVEDVALKFQRPVIFTEAGFASLEGAHREPWNDRRRNLSPEEQARCYEAVFRAFYLKPWFQGVYWWKVESSGSGGLQDGSHTPWGKPAMEVVRRWYLEGGR